MVSWMCLTDRVGVYTVQRVISHDGLLSFAVCGSLRMWFWLLLRLRLSESPILPGVPRVTSV